MAGRSINGTYSAAAHREGDAEQRLRARVGAPDAREQLVRFFAIPDAELEERLGELHAQLPRQRALYFREIRLFGE